MSKTDTITYTTTDTRETAFRSLAQGVALFDPFQKDRNYIPIWEFHVCSLDGEGF